MVNAWSLSWRWPKDRLLAVTDIKWMLGVAVFAKSKGKDWLARRMQHRSHLRSAFQMHTMCPPSGDHLIGPSNTCKDRRIIFGTNGVRGLAHFERISVAPCKNIGDLERSETQRPCATLTAFDRGIILYFGCF